MLRRTCDSKAKNLMAAGENW